MSDQYLWDKTGEPDPDVAHLEAALRPLRHAGAPLNLRSGRAPDSRPRRRSRWLAHAGLAAVALLVVSLTIVWMRSVQPSSEWSVAEASGAAGIGGQPLLPGARLTAGDVIETNSTGRARLRADRVGSITIGPNTRLRATALGARRHWFSLDRGTLDASIAASPGVFAVDTPMARAIDLGCQYTLDLQGGGSGRLYVSLGWVGLERDGVEALVPAGASCALRSGRGPGTPYFGGASPAFVRALDDLDRSGAADRDVLDVVLREARPLDGLALWHLLRRVSGPQALRVYDRLSALVPPPPAAKRSPTISADTAAMSAWWEALGLGDLDELRQGLARAR
jgi:hypothetical protein